MNQRSTATAVGHSPIHPRQLLLALVLGSVPALLAQIFDAKALQSSDLWLASAVLGLGLLFVATKTSFLGRLPWFLGILVALVPPLMAIVTLDGPITNDERSVQWQAELLASGSMAEPLPKAVVEGAKDAILLPDSFRRRQIYEDPATGRRFSKYGPGTALALLPSVLFGVPLLSTLLAVLLDLWLIRLLAFQLGLKTPSFSILLLGTSPFFLLLHSSVQSEVFTTPAVLFGYLAFLRLRSGKSFYWALALGGAAGWVFLARPLTGVLCALVFGVPLLLRKKSFGCLCLAFLGGLPFLAIFLYWNHALSGDWWTPVYSLYAEKYGPFFPGPERIPQDVYGNGDFVAGLLRQSGRWAVAFGGMLGGVGLAFWGTWRLRARDSGIAFSLSVLLPLAYSLHWYAGHRAYLGPLYCAESLALLTLGVMFLLEQAPLAWRRGLLCAMVCSGGVVFSLRWGLIQKESFVRSAPQRVVAENLPPSSRAVVFLPMKYEGTKEKAFKYWTPSLPSDLNADKPLILRTSRRMTPQRLRYLLGLQGRSLYGFVPDTGSPLGGNLQALELSSSELPLH